MSYRVLRHPARLHRYWAVEQRSPNEWCGFLVGIAGYFGTRTEVGTHRLVVDAIERQREHIGLPIISVPYGSTKRRRRPGGGEAA